MVKMAGIVWFAIVLLSVHQVFGRDCSNVSNMVNCNECIRCGGFWCNKPAPGMSRCTLERTNSWCPHEQELVETVEFASLPGKIISPVSFQTTAPVGITNQLLVHYSSPIVQKASFTITNSTQTEDISLQTSTQCEENNCTITIEATPGRDFCRAYSGPSEYINVRITVATIDEAVDIKYQIPCGCNCAQRSELSSERCSTHGDYTCGACKCHREWKGEFCEETDCGHDRGDVMCTNPVSHLDCSGNGYCGGPCQTCQCYTDRPGSQYFDKDNYCSDLCLSIGTYCADDCLRDSTIGEQCDVCPDLVFRPFNRTELKSKDHLGRDVWVNCNETVADCYIEYSAMIGESGDKFVMVTSSCDSDIAGAAVIGSIRVTVPVILGIIGFVIAASAVAGYLFYKNRSPPLPLMDPQYQNIGAEDCTGVNPLYKPPTSSFINPTYKK